MERNVIYLWDIPGLIAGGALWTIPVVLLVALAVLLGAYACLVVIVVRRMQKNGMPTLEKLLWALVIFFLNLIGCVVFLVITRDKRGSCQ